MAACANTGVAVIADSSAAAIMMPFMEIIVASPFMAHTTSIMLHEHAGFGSGSSLVKASEQSDGRRFECRLAKPWANQKTLYRSQPSARSLPDPEDVVVFSDRLLRDLHRLWTNVHRERLLKPHVRR
jgi:hypothetical protein